MEDFTEKKIDPIKNTITYEELGSVCKKIIYPVYSEDADITIIFQDVIGKVNDNICSIEVVGFYFGRPNINLIEEYNGKLQAIFD